MKNITRFGLGLGMLFLTFNSCSPTTAIPVGEQAAITVTGSGEVYVVPDIGYINVGVRTQDTAVTDAIAVNNELANSIQASLVDMGIDEKDIQTSNFNVYQQSDYDYQGNPVNIYYSVENTVYITVRQIESMGEVLDAAARGGANNIYGISFDVQDKSEALSDARVLAVQSAQVQALELAVAAGVTLGDLISVDSSTSSAAPFYGYGMGGGGSESVPIASGRVQVSAQVLMTFTIK